MSLNSEQQSTPIIAVIGPTASGKTRAAVGIARHFDAEIISCDSRQVYRGMDIGTGKDMEEYGEIKAHLINVCEAGFKYNLHMFLTDARMAMADIRARSKNIVLCGGTGMYAENLLAGVKLPDVPKNESLRTELESKSLEELTAILQTYKTLHNTTDVDNPRRAIRAIEIEEWFKNHPLEANDSKRCKDHYLRAIIIGLDIDREKRRERISSRLHARLNEGMVDEIKSLLDSGVPADDLIYYGLEYKFVTNYVLGRCTYEAMVRDLEIAIHQFAKRQMTWFRGMERRGFTINWMPYDLPIEEMTSRIEELITQYNTQYRQQ